MCSNISFFFNSLQKYCKYFDYATKFEKMFPERNFQIIKMFPERNFQIIKMFPERKFQSASSPSIESGEAEVTFTLTICPMRLLSFEAKRMTILPSVWPVR